MKQFLKKIVHVKAILLFFLILSGQNPVSAVETGESENRQPAAADIVNEQLDEMDFSEINQFWEQLIQEYGGFLPELEKDGLVEYIKSAGSFSFKNLLTGLINFTFHELIINGKLIVSLILLTIFSMFLQSLQNAFETTTVSKLHIPLFLWY